MMDRLCRLMPERAAGIIYKQMRSLLDNWHLLQAAARQLGQITSEVM